MGEGLFVIAVTSSLLERVKERQDSDPQSKKIKEKVIKGDEHRLIKISNREF